MPKKELTPKQQKCANIYLSGKSMRESMILAGYTEYYATKECAQYLKHRGLMEYIRKRQADEANAALADAIYVRSRLMELVMNPDPEISLAAIKQLDAHNKWVEELNSKMKSLESEKTPNTSDSPNVVINLGTIEKPVQE
jgi:phage terminase small subunit